MVSVFRASPGRYFLTGVVLRLARRMVRVFVLCLLTEDRH
jgi:hypothetical protein